jgi:hypothetical protein
MKTVKIITTWISSLFLITAGLAVTGCASAHTDKESMLTASGFHAMTPTTAQQQTAYAALPSYELQRHNFNGKVIYAYKDEKAGVVYVGNDGNYQRYQQLVYQQKLANEELVAAEMNQDAALNWGFWGPPGYW